MPECRCISTAVISAFCGIVAIKVKFEKKTLRKVAAIKKGSHTTQRIAPIARRMALGELSNADDKQLFLTPVLRMIVQFPN